MASRDLNDLQDRINEMARSLLDRCADEGLEILIYCTLRPLEEQAKLFRQGRSLRQIRAKAEELRNRWGRPDLADLLLDVGPQSGRRVTYAGPGQSMHNYGLAFDAVPLSGGKPLWQTTKPEDKAMWESYGRLGVEQGLEWAGNWSRFKEFPHMQEEGARWRDLITQGGS
jgi:peptidoglycan L-alanyl-D-glutamate endopeptidase CwlK